MLMTPPWPPGPLFIASSLAASCGGRPGRCRRLSRSTFPTTARLSCHSTSGKLLDSALVKKHGLDKLSAPSSRTTRSRRASQSLGLDLLTDIERMIGRRPRRHRQRERPRSSSRDVSTWPSSGHRRSRRQGPRRRPHDPSKGCRRPRWDAHSVYEVTELRTCPTPSSSA